MRTRFVLINTTKTTLGPVTLLQYLHGKGLGADYVYAPKNGAALYDKTELANLVEAAEAYNLVGISGFTISQARVFQLAAAIKSAYPAAHVILGGPNVIMDPERILVDSAADSVCIDEGEVPLASLISSLGSGTEYQIPGLWFKGEGGIIKNPYGKPLEDLEEIPLENYKHSSYGTYRRLTPTGFTTETSLAEQIDNPSMYESCLYVMTTRGCPFACTYCINASLNALAEAAGFRRLRRMTNRAIVSNLSAAVAEDASIKSIFFFDDDFSLRSEQELEEFAELYRENINLPFHIFANPNTTSNRKMDLYAQAGLGSVEFGVQTVSERVLAIYERPQNAEHLRRILEYARDRRMDIDISFDIITNSPFEHPEDVRLNIEYVLGLPGRFQLYVHSLHLFPGSPLHARYGGGTGNECHEYQDNFSRPGTVYYNEFYAKILFAMQGWHTEAAANRYGGLARGTIRRFLTSDQRDRDRYLSLLDQCMSATRVGRYYKTMHAAPQPAGSGSETSDPQTTGQPLGEPR